MRLSLSGNMLPCEAQDLCAFSTPAGYNGHLGDLIKFNLHTRQEVSAFVSTSGHFGKDAGQDYGIY